jgi:alpha-glucosidase
MRYISCGKVLSHQLTKTSLVLELAQGKATIEVDSMGVVRVQLVKHGQRIPHSYALAKPWSSRQLRLPEVQETPEELVWRLDWGSIHIRISNLAITYCNTSGEVLMADDDGLGMGWLGDRVGHYKVLQPYERFVGLGEKTGNLDRWGRAYTNWNTDAFGYGTETDPIYASIPFYMGVQAGKVYGLFYDSTWKSEINFGASNHRFSSFLAEGGPLTYYFFAGPTPRQIISQYTDLTGRIDLPPLWALGLQQCRYSYYPSETVLQLAQNYRRKGIPADVIYLDIHYMQDFKVFTWHGQDFSDPVGLVKALKELGFRVVVILDPGIKQDVTYAPYQRLKETGAYLRYPDGTAYTASVWPGKCLFPDFSTEEGRNYWAQEMEILKDAGIAGFWTDMNEIASWGQASPAIIEMGLESESATEPDGDRYSHIEGRNIYGAQMAKAAKMGSQLHYPDKRSFVLTRAAYAGTQRHAAIWTGDNTASDEHLLLGVRLQNSLGLSGMAFAGTDIGGFVGEASPDLFARWVQVGCFSPLMRIHSMIDSRPSEPWAYGERVEAIAKNYIKLRYRLLPYLYQIMREASISGIPVVRSLMIDYPHHHATYDHRYQNQYFFGPSFLIIPCVSTQAYTAAWLPPHQGGYYCLYSGKHHADNQELPLASPPEMLPVLVRAGSYYWTQEPGAYTSDQATDTITLHIYHGRGNTTGTYYEDEGEGFGYKQGHCLVRKLDINHQEKTLTIHQPVGSFLSKFKQISIMFHGYDHLGSVMVDGQPTVPQPRTIRVLDQAPSFDPLGYVPPVASQTAMAIDLPFVGVIKLSW